MDAWVYWMIAAVVLAALELIVFTGFIFGPLAVAATVAAIAAALGAGVEIQLAIFLVLGIASMFALRPVAKRHLDGEPELKTNVDALIGKQARVLEELTQDKLGLVRFEEDNWTARPVAGIDHIPADTRVRVVSIAGATAVVEPWSTESSTPPQGADA